MVFDSIVEGSVDDGCKTGDSVKYMPCAEVLADHFRFSGSDELPAMKSVFCFLEPIQRRGRINDILKPTAKSHAYS